MSKTHTFDDGVTVELDDDVEVSDFLEKDGSLTSDEERERLIAEATERRGGVESCDADDEPDGVDSL